MKTASTKSKWSKVPTAVKVVSILTSTRSSDDGEGVNDSCEHEPQGPRLQIPSPKDVPRLQIPSTKDVPRLKIPSPDDSPKSPRTQSPRTLSPTAQSPRMPSPRMQRGFTSKLTGAFRKTKTESQDEDQPPMGKARSAKWTKAANVTKIALLFSKKIEPQIMVTRQATESQQADVTKLRSEKWNKVAKAAFGKEKQRTIFGFGKKNDNEEQTEGSESMSSPRSPSPRLLSPRLNLSRSPTIQKLARSKTITLAKQKWNKLATATKAATMLRKDSGNKAALLTPLAWWQTKSTSQGGRLTLLRQMQEEKTKKVEVQPVEVPPKEPLEHFFAAAQAGNCDAIRQWLPRMAEVDARNSLGETACHAAARCSHVRAVCVLLEAGADPLAKDGNCDLDIEDAWMKSSGPKSKKIQGKSVVYYLRLQKILRPVLEGLFPVTRSRVVQSLCAEIETLKRQAALVFAAKTGEYELADLLLKHGSYTLNRKPVKTEMFMTISGSCGTVGIVESPTVRGAALFAACCAGKTDIVRLLLRTQMPILELRCLDSFERTPLHAAAIQGHAEIVEALLKSHAPDDIYSAQGCTPLLDAVVFGNTSVVQTLLKAGADPCVSIRDTAQSCGGPERIRLIGMSAAEIAAKRINKQCHSLLLDAMSNQRKKQDWEAKLKKSPLYMRDTLIRFEKPVYKQLSVEPMKIQDV